MSNRASTPRSVTIQMSQHTRPTSLMLVSQRLRREAFMRQPNLGPACNIAKRHRNQRLSRIIPVDLPRKNQQLMRHHLPVGSRHHAVAFLLVTVVALLVLALPL